MFEILETTNSPTKPDREEEGDMPGRCDSRLDPNTWGLAMETGWRSSASAILHAGQNSNPEEEVTRA